MVAGGGAFAFLKMGHKPAGNQEAKPKAELKPWTMEEFVVNLRDPAESRYLKVNMTLEVEGEAAEGEGDSPDTAKARDVIINVLTGKSYADLQSPGGKDELKSELRTALNSVLDKKKVVNIYFTSFAMQ